MASSARSFVCVLVETDYIGSSKYLDAIEVNWRSKAAVPEVNHYASASYPSRRQFGGGGNTNESRSIRLRAVKPQRKLICCMPGLICWGQGAKFRHTRRV